MDCSTPGFPVHHQLPELAEIYVHQVSDVIQRLILCHPLLLLASVVHSFRFSSSESALYIRWPKCWEFQLQQRSFQLIFRIPLGLTGWISLQSKGVLRVVSNTAVQKHQFFSIQLSLRSNSHIHT